MIRAILLAISLFISSLSFSQGLGIPSKKGGLGFGNLPRFTGVRLNTADKNIERINGVNVTVWQAKEADQTGTTNGLSIGLPLAAGAENLNGIGIGIAGVAAKNNLRGINVGGLGVGAGGSVRGVNIGGLGVGAGEDMIGINIGGLGAGSGGTVKGINIGGLGIGAGEDLTGINVGGLGVGAGGKVRGINIGGLGLGAANDLTGLSVGGLGVGSGKNINGIAISGIGIGSGKQLTGVAIAGIGVGSPKVRAVAIASCVGGIDVTGLIIAPVYVQVGFKSEHRAQGEAVEIHEKEGTLTGLSISAFHNVRGEVKGVNIGVVNKTNRIKGIQFGLINIVKENPKGLRILPIFNTRFGNKNQD